MWLLDANMDVHLAKLLKELGVACDTASNRQWKILRNGDLVRAASAAGLDTLLTRDNLFGEAASQALKSHPQFAVVVVTLKQGPWPQYRERFLAAWKDGPKARL